MNKPKNNDVLAWVEYVVDDWRCLEANTDARDRNSSDYALVMNSVPKEIRKEVSQLASARMSEVRR